MIFAKETLKVRLSIGPKEIKRQNKLENNLKISRIFRNILEIKKHNESLTKNVNVDIYSKKLIHWSNQATNVSCVPNKFLRDTSKKKKRIFESNILVDYKHFFDRESVFTNSFLLFCQLDFLILK